MTFKRLGHYTGLLPTSLLGEKSFILHKFIKSAFQNREHKFDSVWLKTIC